MTYQVPPGYTLVPNEATIEMCKAMPTLAEVNVEDLVGEWKPREIQNKKRWEAAIRFVREHGLAPAQPAEAALSYEEMLSELVDKILPGQYGSDLLMDAMLASKHLDKHPPTQPAVAAPEGGPSPGPVDRDLIRSIFMQHGFTIKEGQTDLKPYVYEAAEALLRAAAQAPALGAEPGFVPVPREVVEVMSEQLTEADEHDDNGPGAIVCESCGERARMRWKDGYRLDTPADIAHNSACPAKWAKEWLAAHPTVQHIDTAVAASGGKEQG